ncbi:FecR domain-containing protein [Alloalcanivorax sp. C16-1]|uniref:FecR domain-containing protein n=1 Tax=Alloalcanivorax sp. C16-1 TaxID=3390051 RepID=UPI003970E43E
MTDRHTLLREASAWLVRLDAGALSLDEQDALRRWYETSEAHRRVWEAACQLNQRFAGLPAELATPVLRRPRLHRRTVLKSLAGVGLAAPLAWHLANDAPWRPWLAAHRTTVGERRTLTLADGSLLMLNTDTALDVVIRGPDRELRLYQGELFVRTGHRRPGTLAVHTAQGQVRALGTEFAVRSLEQATRVTVVRDAVMLTPLSGAPERLMQGQEGLFSDSAVTSVVAAPADRLSWRQGELVVDGWPLAEVIAELARYRRGVLRCEPTVADLRVSGVFQTDDTELALEVLEQLLPVHITRFTDFWVSVGAAPT